MLLFAGSREDMMAGKRTFLLPNALSISIRQQWTTRAGRNNRIGVYTEMRHAWELSRELSRVSYSGSLGGGGREG